MRRPCLKVYFFAGTGVGRILDWRMAAENLGGVAARKLADRPCPQTRYGFKWPLFSAELWAGYLF